MQWGARAKVLAKTAQDTILKGNQVGMQNIDLMEEAPKGGCTSVRTASSDATLRGNVIVNTVIMRHVLTDRKSRCITQTIVSSIVAIVVIVADRIHFLVRISNFQIKCDTI